MLPSVMVCALKRKNNFSDKSDFAPRLGIAWGIGGSAKKPPKMVLRGGFGIFYDRFLYNEVLEQERSQRHYADKLSGDQS